MNAKKPAVDDKKATTIVANDPDDLKGTLKRIGGSQSDHWKSIKPFKRSGSSIRKRRRWTGNTVQPSPRYSASARKMSLKGMMAAQLLAAHSAAMECYRRAMLGEQTFEGRRENLSQANKL